MLQFEKNIKFDMSSLTITLTLNDYIKITSKTMRIKKCIPATFGVGSFRGIFPFGPDAGSKCVEAESKLVNLS